MKKNKEENNLERIYFPELDGLRFLAFILVFLHHSKPFPVIPFFSTLQKHGWIGVDLFFVLSAYLFTKLLVAEYYKTHTISFRKFYIRRIFRIWPIYFLLVFFSIFFYRFIQHEMISKFIGIRMLGLFTFSDNIMTAFSGYNPITFTKHLWTIGYEEQFYIFIPLIILGLVRASFKSKLISLLVILILLNIIRAVMIANNAPYPSIWVLPITHFESIIMGIVIGIGGLDFLIKKINPFATLVVAILFFILLCELPDAQNISWWNMVSYPIIGISTSFALCSVLESKNQKKFFSQKTLVFLGKRSYGLYVYHIVGNFIAGALIRHISGLPKSSVASFLYSLLFTILISIISYRFIEKPFLIIKKRFEVITSRPV